MICHLWVSIYFQNPDLVIVVDQVVKPEQVESFVGADSAIHALLIGHMLHRQNSLYGDVLDLLPDLVHDFFGLRPSEGFETAQYCGQVIGIVLVSFNRVLSRCLLDLVIGKMDQLVFDLAEISCVLL